MSDISPIRGHMPFETTIALRPDRSPSLKINFNPITVNRNPNRSGRRSSWKFSVVSRGQMSGGQVSDHASRPFRSSQLLVAVTRCGRFSREVSLESCGLGWFSSAVTDRTGTILSASHARRPLSRRLLPIRPEHLRGSNQRAAMYPVIGLQGAIQMLHYSITFASSSSFFFLFIFSLPHHLAKPSLKSRHGLRESSKFPTQVEAGAMSQPTLRLLQKS